MKKEWSEYHKLMQERLKKKDTYLIGFETLFELRNELMRAIMTLYDELNREEFNKIPFMNAKGYHNKTVAYSIWHISRIEDIVAHTLINQDEQVFFRENYQKRINSPIITTGNELIKRQIADFSQPLDLDELYSYFIEVKEGSEKIIKSLSYDDLRKRIDPNRKKCLTLLNVVSGDEKAAWLIDYWCNKDIRGLISMPFSRHWIMHIEAALRIKGKIRLEKSDLNRK